MAKIRLFIEEKNLNIGAKVKIDGADFEYLTKVMRQKIGDKIHWTEVPLIYRGMKDVSWELKPSVGRLYNYTPDLEQLMLKMFKTGARPQLKLEPQNEWEWISLAQLHGLPTSAL